MTDGRKTYAQLLVEERTGRVLDELLRELYVDRRLSQQDIADALSVKGVRVSRALVSEWLRGLGITRDDRPAVAL